MGRKPSRQERYQEGRSQAALELRQARDSGIVKAMRPMVSDDACKVCLSRRTATFPIKTCRLDDLPPYRECELPEGCESTCSPVVDTRAVEQARRIVSTGGESAGRGDKRRPRPKPKRKGMGVGGVISLLAVGLVVLGAIALAVKGPRGDAPVSEPKAVSPAALGHQYPAGVDVQFIGPGDGPCSLAPTERDLEAYRAWERAGRPQPRTFDLFGVLIGDHGRVEEAKPDRIRVVVTSGTQAGRSGWLPPSWVK